MIAHVYELAPHDSHKSFYGKAQVVEAGPVRILFSYNTPVAYFDAAGTFHRTWDGWSAATGRHVVAFGGPGKAAWDKLPVEPVPNY